MTEPREPVCTVAGGQNIAWAQDIHRSSGQPGVKRTLYFVRLINPRVTKCEVQVVVRIAENASSLK